MPLSVVLGSLKFDGDYCTQHEQSVTKALLNVLNAAVTSAIADYKPRAVMVAASGAHFSTSDARPWLRNNGYDVGPNGRISGDLLAVYAAAH